jgi:ATP-dependent exoDNAse (exonuclease V) alpha subunit
VLNQDQMNAADELRNFLASDRREFCLTGQAGTGKTYMLYSILGDSATYCATTNKAASVLRALTGTAQTIHSLLHLTVRNDFSTGKTSLIRDPKATPIRNQIIVVDEASMVDKHLYGIAKEMCAESKIIWVGDDAQLPPVSSGNFSVFKLDLLTANLKQVMRSIEAPAITELSTAVLPRLAGINFHFSTAAIADSSSVSWPLLLCKVTASLSPSADTFTRSNTLPCQPRLRAMAGYFGLGLVP